MEEKLNTEKVIVETAEDQPGKVKVLTLIAGIMQILIGIPIIIGAVALTIYLITTTDPVVLLASLFMIAILYVILGLLILSVGIVWIVFGITIIRCASVDNHDYARRKGLLITTMVFDFIFALGSVVAGFAIAEPAVSIILYVFAALNVLSFLFKVIDISKFNRAVKAGRINLKQSTTKIVTANMSGLSQYANGGKKKEKTLEEKLAEINALKEKAIISEEEYAEMRKNILDV